MRPPVRSPAVCAGGAGGTCEEIEIMVKAAVLLASVPWPKAGGTVSGAPNSAQHFLFLCFCYCFVCVLHR